MADGFEYAFVHQTTRAEMAVRLFAPGVADGQVAGRNVQSWECRFEVEREGSVFQGTARGESWMEVVWIAALGIRQQVPEKDEDDWRTSDGVPFWMRFPQQVPISWGYKPYRFMCDQIEDVMRQPNRKDYPKR